MPVVARDVCRVHYREFDPNNINDGVVCAGLPEGGRGSCFGDSGGPLIDAKTRDLVGVVSRGGEPCGGPGWPGIYERVDVLRSWIVKFLE